MTNYNDEQQYPIRPIRSFVRRQGRFSAKQEAALINNWENKGLDYQLKLIDFDKIFGRSAPIVLEIGFGMGHSFVTMAKNQPEYNYLGIEVHLPGVGTCLSLAKEQQVENIRVINHDAIEVLTHCIPDNSLSAVQLFFPDPWHKTKHHKRRIVQHEFATLVHNKLIDEGVIHMATDWQDYAEHMLKVMNGMPAFCNLSPNNSYIPRPESRPLTKFERRGQRLGHDIWDLQFRKVDVRNF